MRALDTNVLARFFIDDADDAQAAKQRPSAVAALSERAFVAVTVLMELEWVMRGFYGLPPTDISRVLRVLSSIEHITIEDRSAVLMALDAFDQGLDFADALHMARSSRASGFATFDKRSAKRAKGLAMSPPVEWLVRGFQRVTSGSIQQRVESGHTEHAPAHRQRPARSRESCQQRPAAMRHGHPRSRPGQERRDVCGHHCAVHLGVPEKRGCA